MSIEELIITLTTEIKKLNSLLTINNELLKQEHKNSNKKEIKNTNRRRLLNEVEAAEYIAMSRSFLRQDRINGHRENRTKGPVSIKLGRCVRYDIDELDAWLTQHRKGFM